MGDGLRMSMIHWMRQEPLDQTVERLARSDYDGIELNGSPEQYDGTRVRALLGEHEIDAWGAVAHRARRARHAPPGPLRDREFEARFYDNVVAQTAKHLRSLRPREIAQPTLPAQQEET